MAYEDICHENRIATDRVAKGVNRPFPKSSRSSSEVDGSWRNVRDILMRSHRCPYVDHRRCGDVKMNEDKDEWRNNSGVCHSEHSWLIRGGYHEAKTTP